ncbi:MAG TPA: hypothetical protein VFP44_13465, partial [Usitatibacter sp.]|nr:hypothetical protein [Usitatibacter sp.]
KDLILSSIDAVLNCFNDSERFVSNPVPERESAGFELGSKLRAMREGAHADLALFDAATVDEAASYEAPIAPAHGIQATIVNGQVVWRGGKPTGARPGRVLSRVAA